MKKIFTNICVIIMALGLSCSAFAIDATPTASTVFIDGRSVSFEAFNIEGNNYFKLRDLAYVLNNSDNQFSIGYDAATDTIYLTSGQAYISVGGELDKSVTDVIEVSNTSSHVIKDGQRISVSAYNINGSNYFKLRDVGKEIGFQVDYNEQNDSVLVKTKNKSNDESSNLDENGFATDVLKPSVYPTPAPHTTGK